MPTRVLQAIRSQPWAIQPDWLAAIETIAARALDRDGADKLLADGHAQRYPAAIAAMGSRLPGTTAATVKDGVAALPIMGPIFPRASLLTELSGATSLDTLAADLRAIASMETIRAVLLVVDSPGGAVSGVDEFSRLIASYPKPVSVHVSGVCASAAYWIASQAQTVSIDATGIVGSIGVVISTSAQEGIDANGRREVTIVSSNAQHKRPDLLTEAGRDVVRRDLDAIEAVFVSAVAAGRGVPAETVLRDFGQGGTTVGSAAVLAGMADRVDTLGGALAALSSVLPRSQPRRRAMAADLDLRRRGA